MAANFKSGAGIASLGKRLLNRASTRTVSPTLPPAAVRSAHASAYDKNPDNHVHATDDVIQPQSDKYWVPNPQTGVFGPAAEQLNTSLGGEQGIGSGGPGGKGLVPPHKYGGHGEATPSLKVTYSEPTVIYSLYR